VTRDEWVYGVHAVAAALKHEASNLTGLWVERRRDGRVRAIVEEAKGRGIPVYQEEHAALDRMANHARHQGILARLAATGATVRNEKCLPEILAAARGAPLLLVLDGVQDPHNLGACLRGADAAGAHGVIAPADRAVGLTATVRKVACGAAETVPFIQVTNLARALRSLQAQGLWIVGAAGEAETSLYQTDLTGPVALVLGAEEKGLRRLTRETCDSLAHIPMAGTVESLNVSVATGIFLFEAVRQRGR
jgi:23S rRNA (guanosine2251-2'-O)-methyltransferase